jgi:hypothetical protein
VTGVIGGDREFQAVIGTVIGQGVGSKVLVNIVHKEVDGA